MSPQISVIVPSYNASRHVVEAIDSILAQTLPPLEVIVVDDGSTDETEAVLRPYRERTHYIWQPNGGVSAARNRGIRESRGNLIAFLDADDVWFPHTLEALWNRLRDTPEAGLVHSNWFYWRDDTGEKILEYQPGRERDFKPNYPRMFVCNQLIVCVVLIKRECLDRVGLFDESFQGCEDYDLFLRIARRYEFVYVDEPLALYRRHPSNTTNDTLLMLRSELRTRQKALQADPELARLVGLGETNAMMHDRAFHLGYLFHDACRRAEARHYLRVALAYRPWDLYSLLLYMSNLMPTTWSRALRRLKARLS